MIEKIIGSGFEKFVHPHSTEVPTVSGYARNGRFQFNSAAVKEFGLKNKKHCDLYYDKQNGKIGFVFVDEPTNGSVKVKNYRYSLSVAGSCFCNHYGILLDQIKRFSIEKKENMLIIKSPVNGT